MDPLQANPQDMLAYINSWQSRSEALELVEKAKSLQSIARRVCFDYYAEVPALDVVHNWAKVGGTGQQNEQFLSQIRSTLLAADQLDPNGIVALSAASVEENLSTNTAFQALLAAGLSGCTAIPESTYLGIPPTSGFSDDPVSAFNGNFVHAETDLVLPGIAAPLGFARTYNSRRATHDGAFGWGWSCLLDMRIEPSAGILVIHLADGAIAHALPPSVDVPQVLLGRNDYQVRVAEFGYALEERTTGTVWNFDDAGTLLGFEHGIAHVSVERFDSRVVALREERSGRSIAVTWHNDRVMHLTSSDGRIVDYSYEPNGTLVAVSGPSGTFRYRVHDGLIDEIVDADDVVAVVNAYDTDGRVLQQRSVFGRVTTYAYSDDFTTTVTGDDGIVNTYVHDDHGRLLSMTDGLGATAHMNYDAEGRTISTCDRMGFMTFFEHDPESNKVTKITDPSGSVRRFTWDNRGRLTHEWDNDGNVMVFEYDDTHLIPIRITDRCGAEQTLALDDDGRIVATTDADGVRLTFTYNTDGQLVAVSNATTRLGAFEYNTAGVLIAVTNEQGARTEFEVDAAGRVTTSITGGRIATYAYSPGGRPIAGVEPGDCVWRNEYGPHGALVALTDAYGATVRFAYDTHGNQVGIIDPTGALYRQYFDATGNLTTIELPDGRRTQQQFNANGQSVAIVGPDGATIVREVDVLGRTTAITDPTQRTTLVTYHTSGVVESLIAPDGRSIVRSTDAMGRVTAETDPAGRTTTFEYSAAGRLMRRTRPDGHAEAYEYNSVGQCIAMTFDGDRRELSAEERSALSAPVDATPMVSWSSSGVEYIGTASLAQMAANPMLDRAAPQANAPLEAGGYTSMGWDQRGLLAQVRDGQGLETMFTRDPHGWVTDESYVNDRHVTYEHDVVGQVVRIVDGGVPTTYQRDLNGRITGVRYADGSGWDIARDAAGRIVRRTDADGVVLEQFAYDTAGRIVAAIGRNGDRVDLVWDDDDVLVARFGGAMPFALERDASGVTRRVLLDSEVVPDGLLDGRASIEGGEADQEGPTLDSAGRVTRDQFGRILEYDTAGRLASVIDAAGASTFAYDEFGLLASEEGPEGTRAYRYDAVGRLQELTLGDRSIRYAYDAAGRRIREDYSDGLIVEYTWNRSGELEAAHRSYPDGEVATLTVARDPFGLIYAPATPAGIQDRDVWGLPAGNTRDGWWNGGYWAENLAIFPARVYDAVSRQWLSPDLVPTVPATLGAASAYTYCSLDPVNFVDPTGLRPLTQEEYVQWLDESEKSRFDRAWDAIKNDPWGTLMAVGVIAVGVGLMFVPGGQVIGAGILIGVGMSAGIGLATGTFSPRGVALGGVLGGVGAGAGVLFGIGAGALGIGSNAISRIAVGALASGAADAVQQGIEIWRGGHEWDWGRFGTSVTFGAAGAAGGELWTASKATLKANVKAQRAWYSEAVRPIDSSFNDGAAFITKDGITGRFGQMHGYDDGLFVMPKGEVDTLVKNLERGRYTPQDLTRKLGFDPGEYQVKAGLRGGGVDLEVTRISPDVVSKSNIRLADSSITGANKDFFVPNKAATTGGFHEAVINPVHVSRMSTEDVNVKWSYTHDATNAVNSTSRARATQGQTDDRSQQANPGSPSSWDQR
ncbi:MAG: DUF6531 domain-containing protein [Acidimicrobiia bacterium]